MFWKFAKIWCFGRLSTWFLHYSNSHKLRSHPVFLGRSIWFLSACWTVTADFSVIQRGRSTTNQLLFHNIFTTFSQHFHNIFTTFHNISRHFTTFSQHFTTDSLHSFTGWLWMTWSRILRECVDAAAEGCDLAAFPPTSWTILTYHLSSIFGQHHIYIYTLYVYTCIYSIHHLHIIIIYIHLPEIST